MLTVLGSPPVLAAKSFSSEIGSIKLKQKVLSLTNGYKQRDGTELAQAL